MSFPAPLDRLSAVERDILGRYLAEVRFAEGETIFRMGATGDGCFIIDAGDVRLETERPELDTEGVLGYLGPGNLLGELSLLDGEPRSASAYAETAVVARRLSAAAIDTLCADYPAIGMAVVRAMGRDAARKLRAMNVRLAEHTEGESADPEVDAMVAKAQAAQRVIETWPEERIDALLTDIAGAIAARAEELAVLTVRETKLGNVPDKVFKNRSGSLAVLQFLAGKPGIGPLRTDAARGVTEIASPAGVVFGIVPMTTPVATAAFKTLISIKARNALILSFQRACLNIGNTTGEIIRDVLVANDAPADLVQWVKDRSSRKMTARFMAHDGVSLVVATGGAGMVKAAYSSGTPALGVGPGNTPTLIAADARLDDAARAIVTSKSFDNGLICGAEHNLVAVAAVVPELHAALERAGAAVLSPSEAASFTAQAIRPDGHGFRRAIIGQAAAAIAETTGITRPYPIRVIVVPMTTVEFDSPYAREKMTPILSLFTVPDTDAGIALCRDLLAHEGTGHTSIIHSTDPALIARFGAVMPTSRILVNCPGSQGISGLTSGLPPSFTLGCGLWGGNSTTDNVTFTHLMNVKRLAQYLEPPVAPAPAAAGTPRVTD